MNKIEMSPEDALEQVKNSFIFDNYIVGDMGPWFITFSVDDCEQIAQIIVDVAGNTVN